MWDSNLAIAEAQLDRRNLWHRYQAVRQYSEWLCRPLQTEDYVVQSMPDVSPTRWHLAHTTWFFETFIVRPSRDDYRPLDSRFEFLFNSYYNGVGQPYPRAKRGILSRPTVAQIYQYRAYVDAYIERVLIESDEATLDEIWPLIELGLHHEQQHQELMLTDIKHVFACNPLFPSYQDDVSGQDSAGPLPVTWTEFDEGLFTAGYEGERFHFDNETPRHSVFLQPYRLANQLVTNGQYLEFIEDHGYRRPELWLSDGWAMVLAEGWEAPLYWYRQDGAYQQFTLAGLRPLDLNEPVCHISYYEADAFARWADKRLPTEFEWERATEQASGEGQFAESGRFHPAAASFTSAAPEGPRQMFGDVWEWTGSAYLSYPGYQPPAGAIGEYNGKFMCNQFVLRGGSCVTSRSHIRSTYRNFFPPGARWQFTGIRLCQ